MRALLALAAVAALIGCKSQQEKTREEIDRQMAPLYRAEAYERALARSSQSSQAVRSEAYEEALRAGLDEELALAAAADAERAAEDARVAAWMERRAARKAKFAARESRNATGPRAEESARRKVVNAEELAAAEPGSIDEYILKKESEKEMPRSMAEIERRDEWDTAAARGEGAILGALKFVERLEKPGGIDYQKAGAAPAVIKAQIAAAKAELLEDLAAWRDLADVPPEFVPGASLLLEVKALLRASDKKLEDLSAYYALVRAQRDAQ